MVYENITLILSGLTFLFALITLMFVARNREFERGEVETSVNALLFGFFITLVITLIKFIESLDSYMHDSLANAIPQITTYVGYLVQIETLALAPLLAVCFLVAIFLVRDVLEK